MSPVKETRHVGRMGRVSNTIGEARTPECRGSITQHGGRFREFLRDLDVHERCADPDASAGLDFHRTTEAPRIHRLSSMHAITAGDDQGE
jgi:hypothetical protein